MNFVNKSFFLIWRNTKKARKIELDKVNFTLVFTCHFFFSLSEYYFVTSSIITRALRIRKESFFFSLSEYYFVTSSIITRALRIRKESSTVNGDGKQRKEYLYLYSETILYNAPIHPFFQISQKANCKNMILHVNSTFYCFLFQI